MDRKQFVYTRKIGRNTYSVIIKQTEGATEQVDSKIKRLLLNDLIKVG